MKSKTTYTHDFFSILLDKNFALAFIFVLAFTMFSNAQDAQISGEAIYLDRPVCEYPIVTGQEMFSIPNSLGLSREAQDSNGTACSTFNVTYNGFTPEAQTAFQFAVDIWSNTLESNVPIFINATFADLGPGILGSAGPNGLLPLTGAGLPPNTIYARALAENITGIDSNFGGTDINANFSSTANFYFGLDANPPFNQVDFVSVVLHELGHGLGFLSLARTNGTSTEGLLRNQGFVTIYDQFIENLGGTSILTFADPSTSLLNEFTGGNLFCNSALAVAANGGSVRPETYAPNPFNQGSSYSHWDELIFPSSNINSLMTPFIGNGQANHNPGPITIAFFEDMGWNICPSLSVNEFTLESLEIAPNPFNDAVRITLPGNYNDSDFNISVFDINGREVYDADASSINRIIDINLSQLNSSIYFMQLKDSNTGLTVTKKVIKQ